MKNNSIAYLLLGSNLGNQSLNLEQAISLISSDYNEVIEISKTYKTAAWGNLNQDDYLNVVLKVETQLNPFELLDRLLKIENQLGRTRGKEHWQPRLIDIDILYYNDEIIASDNLKIPHPYIAQRRFTLVPLNDIAADFMHPILKLTNKELLAECEDKGEVLSTSIDLIISNSGQL
ncbi:MAG TPA: 2-amino-4-hydroxy-6-hydroxymethyldihydropteridine diphosphokinase [Bacteroidia bacterium]|nr:2-amino-4-hydroxy-6-hydroxymethyldihydropteridine diphosphokinase [Bacteroidia bacterium]